MDKILIPFDGSVSAVHAAQFVVKRALNGQRVQVELLNVQIPLRSNAAPAASADEIRRAQEAEGERVLQPARDILTHAGLHCRVHVLIGEPEACIGRCAQEQGVSEIVMGTRGMGAVVSLVLGSVATKVVHLVDIPVTLVK